MPSRTRRAIDAGGSVRTSGSRWKGNQNHVASVGPAKSHPKRGMHSAFASSHEGKPCTRHSDLESEWAGITESFPTLERITMIGPKKRPYRQLGIRRKASFREDDAI